MNRRDFFRTLAAATAGFTILPPATTYQRVWKARVIEPELLSFDEPFNPVAYAGRWKFVTSEVELLVPCTEFKEQWLNDFATAIKPTRLKLVDYLPNECDCSH